MSASNQHCFIIGGVPQSGKSGVSKKLRDEFGASIFPLDALVSSMHDAFPQLAITHFTSNPRIVCEKLSTFTQALARHTKYEGLNFVIEGYHISPKTASVLRKDGFKCVFLGYVDVNVEAKITEIRMYARTDHWTTSLSEDELESLIIRYEKESREIQSECSKLGIPFVEVSHVPTAIDQAWAELVVNPEYI
jgi:2-phosphoglycerate kinase